MRIHNLFWNCHVMVAGLALVLVASPALADCSVPISSVNTSNNSNVVGSGTPDSCTEDAFNQAINKGGTITFNCGSSPYTLTLNSTKTIKQDTVIDGGNLVTLSGGNQTRILSIDTGNFLASSPTLTVQNITLANGYGPNSPDSGTASGGGAIYRFGGTLNVINSRFINNAGPASGQDDAGGAIYSIGTATTTIVGSDFEGNQASNGGALGNIGNNLILVNSTVNGNKATGTGGNPGNGGNGGGIYIDGNQQNVSLCGDQVNNNQANQYGGAFIRVTYQGNPTTIDQSTINGNSINTPGGFAAGIYNQGGNLNLTNSTVTNSQAAGAIASLVNVVVFSGSLNANNDTINP
ncbi:MAG: hypothetical protein JOZ78_11620 [Chroococcidiopsidaceae cyanobacterium CP_BM_ER_R8_30]|nr:hypothetical protein [Chroococcidiopsidaceae cyanobacterium CP_BM_ER_R8_30]